MTTHRMVAPGPYTVDQIREGDPYELSNGHLIECLPTGRRGGRSNAGGVQALDTDPAVTSAGVDVGFSANPGHLRAPDISIGNVDNEPGWAHTAPPLAVEYADTGQDEADLQSKITELLAAGTKFIWVVRLVGPRRVEVYTPGKPKRLVYSGDELTAPGILQNSVPVDALFDREAAHEVTLRNLLQRKGFASLEDVHERGKREGLDEGKLEGKLDVLRQILTARGLDLTAEQRRRINDCKEIVQVEMWIQRSLGATQTSEIFVVPPAEKPARRKRSRA